MKKILISLLLSLPIYAEVTQEELYEVQADIASIKNDLETTKNLAEQERASAFNPSLSVIGSLLGNYVREHSAHKHEHSEHKHGHGSHNDHSHQYGNGFFIRELEFEFSGEIDPYARAQAIVAIEQSPDYDFNLHVEEALIQTGLLGIELKIGKFKAAIGRANRIHRHHLNQIDYPLATKVFLGEEGFANQGISNKFSFNTQSNSALTFFLESGMGIASPMQKKGSTDVPSANAHAWWHTQLDQSNMIDLGSSAYVARQGKARSKAFFMFAGDVHYSYLPSGYGADPVFLLGTEFFSANPNTVNKWPMGGFVWSQFLLFSAAFLGVRYDIAPKAKELDHMESAASIYFTYYTSEFLRFRLGYEHAMADLHSIKGDDRFSLSMNFVLGSHPSEPYFITR
jgi:hypothetical protein